MCALDRQICALHAGSFLLDAGMKSVFSLRAPALIQSVSFLSQAFAPSGYLSFHHNVLLDLSPSGYLSLTAEMVLSDSKSTSQTS
jgi:hypothetical protein